MVERRRVATEWDMGWFCSSCECLKHWKETAYIVCGRYYCEKCYKEKYERNK